MLSITVTKLDNQVAFVLEDYLFHWLDPSWKRSGQSQWIDETTTFTNEEAKGHKYPGQEGARWELNVVDNHPDSEAPLVGVLQNRFQNDTNSFVGKEEEGVTRFMTHDMTFKMHPKRSNLFSRSTDWTYTAQKTHERFRIWGRGYWNWIIS